jgi:tRNA A37 threonylcarbamoyladenosine dehydratase
MHWLERTDLLFGKEKLLKLNKAHVLVVGLGGVGAHAAEQLCRAGIGKMSLVDSDSISDTNLNRQLLALHSTIGKQKVELMANRLKDINPNIIIQQYPKYLKNESIPNLLNQGFDYVIDAIDTLSPKTHLIRICLELQIPVVSSMGSGGKTNPTKIQIADISKSYNCNLARILRKRLHRLGIYTGVDVVFSSEKTDKESIVIEESENKKSNVGTISYMPAIFGCYAASVVIKNIAGIEY